MADEHAKLDTSGSNPDTYVSSASVSGGATWRNCAVTTSGNIAIKGVRGWVGNLDVLTDTDGCDNIMDFDFAMNHLQLQIIQDSSSQALGPSASVGGSAYLSSYVETPCDFKGTKRMIQFYMVKNLQGKH